MFWLFGVLERAGDKASSETATRTLNQYPGDAAAASWGDELYVTGR